MTYRITKRFNPDKGYSCAFRNWRAQSHCRWWHGYDLIFEVTLQAEKLNEFGWVYDFGAFKDLKQVIENHFDHRTIIAYDDPEKETILEFYKLDIISPVIMENVGIEYFACWFAVQVEDMLMIQGQMDRVKVHSARVYETGANFGEYLP